MKRILGMMLASRMAGRGMRGGIGHRGLSGGGLGGLAAAGLLGGRRGGLGRKAGLAALGYMAYRAYQDHQARSGTAQAGAGASGNQTSAGHTGGGLAGSSASGNGIGGALGGVIKSLNDALTGGTPEQGDRNAGYETRAPGTGAAGASSGGTPVGAGPSSERLFSPEDERAAETFSEETALLLLRAMITAANADGTISADERSRIMGQADEAGADVEDRHTLERELANPRPLDELLGQVKDQETAEEFYLASRMAVDGETQANRVYLGRLRERLGLAEQEAAEIDTLAS